LPQLVKGGKHAYGWSKVNQKGTVAVPDEALKEYNLKTPSKIILMTASKRSGGFAITNQSLLKNSKLAVILDNMPSLAEFQLPEGETVKMGTKTYCWVKLNSNKTFTVPLETLKKYEVNAGDSLLLVRGSCLALSFIVKGPIIEEAKKHVNLPTFN
jgi:bifunctional DNA-binding transcriptional regulator/antitoxin component of YhaV-PrlF toxin-antitoxin module